MTDLIRLSQVRFRYDAQGPWVLDVPEFRMQAGEKVFLLGPSGSGKSTLLELLSGVLSPTEGEVSILGISLSTLTQAGRDHFRGDRLGYIFQSFNLIPYLSIQENIELPVRFNPGRAARIKTTLPKELNHLVERLGLSGLLNRKVSELSVGQQQRVAAARALIGSPSLILADEPTSALDFDHRQKFIELLFSVAAESGAGVLFVSHDHSLKTLFDRSVNLTELNRVKP